MIRFFEYIRARLGAKMIAAFIATLAIAAMAQIVVTFQFGSSLADHAAQQSSEALRAQARATLKRLTREQADRYNQIFADASSRTRLLAWQAGHQLASKSASDPRVPVDLRWHPDMAFHVNGDDASLALLHWGSADVTAAAREQMRALTHLVTPMKLAQREIKGAAASWILTERRVGAYFPNRPGIESTAPAGEAAMLDSRSYRTGNAAAGQTRWTKVYQDVAGQGPIITATSPIHGPDNKAFLGVAGIDLTVRRTVNRVLRQDPIGIDQPADANGPPAELSFLMDAHTKPIAVPKDHRSLLGLPVKVNSAPGEALSRPPLAQSDPADLRRAARRAVETDHLLVDDLTLNGRTYIAAFHTISATDWVLANVVAEKALLSRVAATREAIGQRVASMTAILAAFGAGLMLLMATGLMVYFRRAVLRPLGYLADATARMRSGQYRVAVPVDGDDELARVSQGFNDLSDRLADVLEDLEQRVRARTREAESARDHFRSILRSSPVGIVFVDGNRRIQQVNPATEELLGRPEKDLIGKDTRFFYRDQSEFERVGREAIPQMSFGGVCSTVVTLERPDGNVIIVSMTGRAVNPDALEEGYIWILQDITAQRRQEVELERLATHDRLTGVYNRTKLEELLEVAQAEHERYGTPFSVVMFDIDHFKAINDTHGHGAGDTVLRDLTGRARGVLRETDHFGRWGGEEFVILASETDRLGAEHLAERVRRVVADAPFSTVGAVTVSLGVVEFHLGEPLAHVEERADRTLYAAKKAGRNRVRTEPRRDIDR